MLSKLYKLGYRKWYERTLIESHLWLLTCIVCIVLVCAGFELLTSEKQAGRFLIDGVVVAIGAYLTWFSWQRYASSMVMAESVAQQATCSRCKYYGFKIDRAVDVRNASVGRQLKAICPKCSHRWTVENYRDDS